MVKHIYLGFIMGMVYFTMEGFWRGWTNIAMLFIGGICGVLVGLLNEQPGYYKLKIWQQCLIGTIIILGVEFISGLVLNVWLGLHIWDYSDTWGNILGQVCLPYAALWFILTPFAIWLDDLLRAKLYLEGQTYSIGEIFVELVSGK